MADLSSIVLTALNKQQGELSNTLDNVSATWKFIDPLPDITPSEFF